MAKGRPGGLMSALASLATRPDLDTMVAHISPDDAAFLKRRGGAGQGNPRTGLMQFWSDGGGDESDSIGGGRRGGDSGFSDTMGGSSERDGRGVSNADATRGAQSDAYGSYRDAVARGYQGTPDALADARGWGVSLGDAIGIAGDGYGYDRGQGALSGMNTAAHQSFAGSFAGTDPVRASDLGMASPGLMGAMSQAQQYGAPRQASMPQRTPQMAAAIQQTPISTFKANYPRATNNPFGIMNAKTGKLASFTSPQIADAALDKTLANKRYSGKQISDVVKTYVGDVDPVKQEEYIQHVEKWTGMPRTATFDPANKDQLRAMKSAIMRQESGGNYDSWSRGLY